MMITCDRKDGLVRAAVWRGKQLVDLYVDREALPDETGALVYGQVVRALPSKGEVFLDAGLAQNLFLKSKANAGTWLAARVLSTQDEGKAWRARAETALVEEKKKMVLESPPTPWQRALADHKAQLLFEEALDYKACAALGLACEKGRDVHPALDEIIEDLLNPVHGSVIVEQTRAFWAVDINGPLDKNPTALNLEAVPVIARLLRLCNIGGLVVMDCLKMPNRADGAKLRHAFERALAQDPAKPQVFGPTRLGLIEIARPARGPSLHKIYGR